ncbi:MAG: exodeoxyribonuclease VII small subunit [Clostridia bacterium]|nr:exodeoxyribonuclease VII small subunit [Clostridia bacterium]
MTNSVETNNGTGEKLDLTFEQAAAELDTIVNKLNSGSVQLDEMIALFERGTKLAEHCSALLAQYDGRIAKAMGAGTGAEQ